MKGLDRLTDPPNHPCLTTGIAKQVNPKRLVACVATSDGVGLVDD